MKRVIAMLFLAPVPLLLLVALYAFGVSDINSGMEFYFLAFIALPCLLGAYVCELMWLPWFRRFKRRGLIGWAVTWRVALVSLLLPAALLVAIGLVFSSSAVLRMDRDSLVALVAEAIGLLVVAFTFWWLGFRHNDALLPVAEDAPPPLER